MNDASVIPDSAQGRRHLVVATIMASLLGIFTLDSVTPLGYSVWMLYIFPVWYSTRLSPASRLLTVAATAASTVLMAADFVVSPSGGMHAEIAVFNRSLGAILLWVLAVLLLRSGVNEERATESQLALRESEEFNRAVLESSPDCMKILDRDGRLLSINHQGLCLMEIDDGSSVYGKYWWDLWPEASRETVQSAVQEALVKGTARFQGLCPTAKGTPKWWDVMVSTVRGLDGRPTRLVSTSRDITVIKQAEEAVRESEERLALALNGTNDGVWDWNIQADQEYLSPRCKALLGFERHELTPDPQLFFGRVHPDDLERVREAVAAHLAQKVPFDIELRLRMKNDDPRWFRACGRAVWNEEGLPVRMAGSINDIHDRKCAEEAIQKYVEALEIINETNLSLPSHLDRQSIVQVVTDAGRKLCGAQGGAFLDKGGDPIGGPSRPTAWSGTAREALAQLSGAEHLPIFGPQLWGRGPVRLEDITKDPRYANGGLHGAMPAGLVAWRSYLAVPIVSRSDEVLGGLLFGHERPGMFTAQHERILMGIAAQAAVAIDHARLYQRLTDSEERYRFMIEQVRDYAIIMLDPDGRIATWNAGAQRHTGYASEEVIGRPFSLFFEQGERMVGQVELEQAVARGVYEQEGWRVRRDGSRFWAHVVTTPLRDETGALRGFTKVWRDNTKRKLVETQFQQLVEQSPNGILTVDGRGQIMLVNREIERIFGYGREALLNQPVEWLIPKRFREGHPQHRAQYVRESQTRPMGKGMPLYGLHKSGREFPVEVGLTPIETFQGKMTLCTVVDVTERKKAEEDLLAANREMEAFTYMVSHDLRAPVRTMAGFARILMEDFGPALEPEARRHVRTIQKGAQRMGELIDDLLEFSRVGRSALECRPVNMNKLIEEVWEDLKSQRDGRNIELEAADLPWCLGDRRLLALVWINLLANAVKYTGPREQARIEVGWRPDEERPEWVTITVTDNGVGFDQQYVDKLFRVFQRLHREDEFEGTGVGLAIVHRIVTRHGGRVGAEGRLGEGATVYVTLEKAS